MPTALSHSDDLREHLDRWVAEMLITPREAEAIGRFEAADRVARPRRVSLITESVAYLGFALAASAGAVLLADYWPDMDVWGHLLTSGGLAFGLLVAGSLRRGSDDPAIVRLSSVLWALSVACFAWFAWLLAHDQAGWTRQASTLGAGLVSLAIATTLWAFRPLGLQQAAMFGASAMTLIGVAWDQEVGATLVWAFAVAWATVAAFGRLEPRRAAMLTGSVVALYATMFVPGAGMWMGLGTALAMVGASIPLRQPALLGLGVIGTFIYLMRVVGDLFGGTVGVPIALFAIGAVAVAFALWLARGDRLRTLPQGRRGASPAVGRGGRRSPTLRS